MKIYQIRYDLYQTPFPIIGYADSYEKAIELMREHNGDREDIIFPCEDKNNELDTIFIMSRKYDDISNYSYQTTCYTLFITELNKLIVYGISSTGHRYQINKEEN